MKLLILELNVLPSNQNFPISYAIWRLELHNVRYKNSSRGLKDVEPSKPSHSLAQPLM